MSVATVSGVAFAASTVRGDLRVEQDGRVFVVDVKGASDTHVGWFAGAVRLNRVGTTASAPTIPSPEARVPHTGEPIFIATHKHGSAVWLSAPLDRVTAGR